MGTSSKGMDMFDERTQRLRSITTLLDIALTVAAFLISYYIQGEVRENFSADILSHLALLPLIIALWGFSLSYFGAYRPPRGTSRFDYGWAVLRAVITGTAILLTLLFVLKIQYVSRAVVVTFAILNVFLLVGLRVAIAAYFRHSLKRGDNYHKVLIIGTGNRAIHLSETLRRQAEWGLHIVGHLDPDATRTGKEILGSKVLGTLEDIHTVLKGHVIDEVIIAIPRAMIPNVDKIAFACEEEGVKLRMMADVFDVHVARMRLVEVGTVPLLTLESVSQEEWKVLVKRVFDLVAAICSLPIFGPVMIMTAIAIKLDSQGPVFFMQERIGQNKRRFRMYKFRSMVVGSENKLKELEHLNEAEGPIFKIKNDPRVTRVGNIIRKTSIDELPQIFNVIRGEMSLVGPRPMSVRDVDLFDKGIQRKRFSVKPGLTCLWQVSGRSQLPFHKWLELDLYYIENWSLALDLKILFKTIPVVLKGTGAV